MDKHKANLGTHLLLVSLTPGKRGDAIGVLTLEDIIAEIPPEEIADEKDRLVELHQRGLPVSVSSADCTPVIMNVVPSLTRERMWH
ncbi:hypothetical protein DFH08DRAFT_976316 [Mycena albidolilacea]|uniref:CBS domain-containing protein n=1 Tax=Mycena albidolilacea TaxID=1033008 RepID=A0AAD7E9R2_9AGAR|nr:hypothetical protein DFH08DRAFT_976316 [Mycena albidolilacea]